MLSLPEQGTEVYVSYMTRTLKPSEQYRYPQQHNEKSNKHGKFLYKLWQGSKCLPIVNRASSNVTVC